MFPLSHKLFKNAGFTMAETIIVVSIMAIIVSMSAPPIVEFMKRRDIQTEQNTMNEVLKAMNAYLEDRNDLPLDSTTTWSSELAKYSNLSANQIAKDTWGNNRVYVTYSLADNFLGTPVTVYYATLHSMGPDNKAAGGATVAGGAPTTGTGIAAATNAFSALTSNEWWKK